MPVGHLEEGLGGPRPEWATPHTPKILLPNLPTREIPPPHPTLEGTVSPMLFPLREQNGNFFSCRGKYK